MRLDLRHVLQFQVSPNTLINRTGENSPTSISDMGPGLSCDGAAVAYADTENVDILSRKFIYYSTYFGDFEIENFRQDAFCAATGMSPMLQS